MTTPAVPPLPALLYEDLVRNALREDLGRAGDVTSDAIVPADLEVTARLVVRSPGRVAGLAAALSAFRLFDRGVAITARVHDGFDADPDTVLAELAGSARSVLAAERTALNLLGHLCGVATQTRDVVAAVEPWGTRVACTRKTLPLLRSLQKYAVRVGGGSNHRFGLDDAVLIKDNHRAVAGGAAEAVCRVRAAVGHLVAVEVEVEDLDDLRAVLDLGVHAVLLDNMSPAELAEAVRIVDGRAVTEASGSITPQSAPEFAASGVDILSLGWLTHSVPALDVGLDVH